MDTDEIAPPPKTNKPVVLDTMSVFELEARIAELEAEIVRARAAIAKKKSAQAAADSIFKKT